MVKVGMAISLYFHGISFCFINSHLTSGDERWLRWAWQYHSTSMIHHFVLFQDADK